MIPPTPNNFFFPLITFAGIFALTPAITQSYSLQRLNLGDNDLRCLGVVALARALETQKGERRVMDDESGRSGSTAERHTNYLGLLRSARAQS